MAEIQSPQYGPPNGGRSRNREAIPTQGFDLAAMIAMFSQMQQQGANARLQGQRERQQGIRRDMSGNVMDQNTQGPWGGPITFNNAGQGANRGFSWAPQTGALAPTAPPPVAAPTSSAVMFDPALAPVRTAPLPYDDAFIGPKRPKPKPGTFSFGAGIRM